MEYLVLAFFCLSLVLCLFFGFNLLYALFFGLLLFSSYALIKGFSAKDVVKMAFSGVKTVKNILFTFLLIGIITATWRASGTIAVIVSLSSNLITPTVLLLMTFILCSLLSFLTGTAFGTAATIGVICSTMAQGLGVSPLLTGGAVVAGSYFGDRCSPVSTSALLVATITKTDIFKNVKRMLKSAAIPFFVSCGIYVVIGILSKNEGHIPNLKALFEKDFILSPIAVAPAIILLILAILRFNVRIVMAGGIVSAILICIFIQKTEILDILKFCLYGYTSKSTELTAMMDGGGIVSMLRVTMIVCISSAYSGIFKKTGLLDNIQKLVAKSAKATTPFVSTLLTSIIAGMVACNQTLTIMLTDQLCSNTEPNKEKFALILENSAVVVAPLIPWSIAGGVPLASVGCPTASLCFALFLYLLPICEIIFSYIKKRENVTK